MNRAVYFNTEKIMSIDTILNRYNKNEFKSPYRSTIPLLALFKQNPSCFDKFANELSDVNADFIFEAKTPVKYGKGPASSTDLMIIGQNTCIAIEAKRTEPKYITVNKWLKESKNGKDVLKGWLEYIEDYTGVKLEKDQIINFPYQMVHRVASACSNSSKKAYVFYIGFDLKDNMKEYYSQKLNDFSGLLLDKIPMKLICYNIIKNDLQEKLEHQWDKGVRDLSGQVINGIVKDQLMSFHDVD